MTSIKKNKQPTEATQSPEATQTTQITETIQTTQASQPTETTYECENIPYTFNRFGDILIQWHTISEDQLLQNITRFIDALKKNDAQSTNTNTPSIGDFTLTNKNSPFIIEIPHERASIIPAIKQVGFTLHCANNEKTVWIITNGSSIPAPYTAIASAIVIVLDQGNVLAIEETTRPGLLCFPSGHVDAGEFIHNAAVRELYEEGGLTVHPQDLLLIGAINRIRANPQGASSYTYCYFVQKNKITGEEAGTITNEIASEPIKETTGEATCTIATNSETTNQLVTETHITDTKIINTEVIQKMWVPLIKLLGSQRVNKLQVHPFIHILAQHIHNKCVSSQKYTVPDYRQFPMIQDPHDIMHIELFAQNIQQ